MLQESLRSYARFWVLTVCFVASVLVAVGWLHAPRWIALALLVAFSILGSWLKRRDRRRSNSN
jgi:Flp pilus assembly protein TadB